MKATLLLSRQAKAPQDYVMRGSNVARELKTQADRRWESFRQRGFTNDAKIYLLLIQGDIAIFPLFVKVLKPRLTHLDNETLSGLAQTGKENKV